MATVPPLCACSKTSRCQCVCDIGPWNHSCPDDGTPGPNYEWVERMTQWFGQYLNVPAGEDAAEISAKGAGKARAASAKKHKPTRESLVYVRHGHEPDSKIETVPGYWRKDALPARGTVIETVALAPASCPRSLAYKAFGGTAAGTWWGDLTGEMAGDDADSLVVDSPALEKPKQIIGSRGHSHCQKHVAARQSGRCDWRTSRQLVQCLLLPVPWCIRHCAMAG
ncbi:MAG: hypothetical protein IPO31_23460 [Candidatus Obscuribacter sp.]|nr:hypothetical protein [Candidatus Obscuribacter sp.]